MAMLGCGAAPVQLSWIQLGPWASPDEKGFGMAPHFSTQAFLYGMLVNPKTGKRFVNELADRKVRADAILGTDNTCILFATAEKMKDGSVVDSLLPKMLEKGVAKKFETLDELAGAYGIPADELKKEVERFNGFVAAGLDEDYGKPFPQGAEPIKAGPYLAVRLWPKIHHTMGGALINKKAEVVDPDRQNPSPGYMRLAKSPAASMAPAGWAAWRSQDCLVFGRLAGQNAAGATGLRH